MYDTLSDMLWATSEIASKTVSDGDIFYTALDNFDNIVCAVSDSFTFYEEIWSDFASRMCPSVFLSCIFYVFGRLCVSIPYLILSAIPTPAGDIFFATEYLYDTLYLALTNISVATIFASYYDYLFYF